MERSETESEARARRSVHVIGATIVLFTVAAVVFGVSGGSEWAQRRQMRGIQAGVKADLMLVAEAESRFHKIHGFYTTDLRALNLWPKRVLFAFGFVKPSTYKAAAANPEGLPPGVAPGSDADPATWDPELRTVKRLADRRAEDAINKAKTDPNFKADPPILLSPITKITAIDFNRLISFCPDCTATKDTFKVIAAADLDSDPVLDVWTIDQNGTIQHLIDDLQ